MLQVLQALKAVVAALGISGTFQFLKALPDLIRIIKEIVNVIREVSGGKERAAKTKEVKEALRIARETGNTSQLESLFK